VGWTRKMVTSAPETLLISFGVSLGFVISPNQVDGHSHKFVVAVCVPVDLHFNTSRRNLFASPNFDGSEGIAFCSPSIRR
jgi:hypothetical protein